MNTCRKFRSLKNKKKFSRVYLRKVEVFISSFSANFTLFEPFKLKIVPWYPKNKKNVTKNYIFSQIFYFKDPLFDHIRPLFTKKNPSNSQQCLLPLPSLQASINSNLLEEKPAQCAEQLAARLIFFVPFLNSTAGACQLQPSFKAAKGDVAWWNRSLESVHPIGQSNRKVNELIKRKLGWKFASVTHTQRDQYSKTKKHLTFLRPPLNCAVLR